MSKRYRNRFHFRGNLSALEDYLYFDYLDDARLSDLYDEDFYQRWALKNDRDKRLDGGS